MRNSKSKIATNENLAKSGFYKRPQIVMPNEPKLTTRLFGADELACATLSENTKYKVESNN